MVIDALLNAKKNNFNSQMKKVSKCVLINALLYLMIIMNAKIVVKILVIIFLKMVKDNFSVQENAQVFIIYKKMERRDVFHYVLTILIQVN